MGLNGLQSCLIAQAIPLVRLPLSPHQQATLSIWHHWCHGSTSGCGQGQAHPPSTKAQTACLRSCKGYWHELAVDFRKEVSHPTRHLRPAQIRHRRARVHSGCRRTQRPDRWQLHRQRTDYTGQQRSASWRSYRRARRHSRHARHSRQQASATAWAGEFAAEQCNA